MEGRDLHSRLDAINRAGERLFSWYGRGRTVAVDVARALHYLHRRAGPVLFQFPVDTMKRDAFNIKKRGSICKGDEMRRCGSGWAWRAPCTALHRHGRARDGFPLPLECSRLPQPALSLKT